MGAFRHADQTEQVALRSHHANWTIRQRALIQEELRHILSDPIFKTSRRCQLLLRALVERTMAGNTESIKERTLGAEVFGRNPGYDTNADPVIRMAANETRKRLAQFYQSDSAVHEVTIQLERGGYIPEFIFHAPEHERIPDIEPASKVHDEKKVPSDATGDAMVAIHALPSALWRISIVALTLAILAPIVVFLLWRSNTFASTQKLIWKPFLDAKQPIVICVSDRPSSAALHATSTPRTPSLTSASTAEDGSSAQKHTLDGITRNFTPFADALISDKITKWMIGNGQQTRLRPSSEFSFYDFRMQPVVLVGFDNPWASRILSKARYSIRTDPAESLFWIQDAQNPELHNWQLASQLQAGGSFTDYGIITRLFDNETGQWIMVIQGLGGDGTLSAAEILGEPNLAFLLPSTLRKCRNNIQIVVKDVVVKNSGGPPQIVAVHTW
jgi:hypothetical protein